MISAYSCTYVTIIGGEDANRIRDAKEIIKEIYDATVKVNGGNTETSWLSGTIDVLNNILEGKPIDC